MAFRVARPAASLAALGTARSTWSAGVRWTLPGRLCAVAATDGRQRFQSTGACTKESHPRQWAIWRKLDTDRSGTLTRKEIREMCRKFDATSHAALLEDILDPENRGYTDFDHFCRHFSAVATVRTGARLKNWHRTYGLGVAGNVAGHMAQAGEADAGHEEAVQTTPAAIFTFYAPHPHTIDATEDEVLALYETFPVTNAVIDYPKIGGDVQVEPELGLYVDIVYARDGKSVERLVPRRVAAFNDCSIRRLDGSEKLTEKKNWGFGSKGISLRSFRVDSISKGTMVDQLVLSSFILRNGQVQKYSVDAPARNYLMFHDELIDWIVDRINNQGNTGKWMEIFKDLVKSDYPTSMWIALGAGEYTEWGATNFLQPKDETLVIVYDEQTFPDGPNEHQILDMFDDGGAPAGVIALHQTFV